MLKIVAADFSPSPEDRRASPGILIATASPLPLLQCLMKRNHRINRRTAQQHEFAQRWRPLLLVQRLHAALQIVTGEYAQLLRPILFEAGRINTAPHIRELGTVGEGHFVE